MRLFDLDYCNNSSLQYCSREDKDKTIIQTTIDYVHEQYMYADSIFGKFLFLAKVYFYKQ